MNKLLGILIGLLLVIAIPTTVSAAWGTPFWKFSTSGGIVLEIDDSGNLNSTGTLNGTQLISSIAQGTAPLIVASTTEVTNLNASTATTAYDLTCTNCIGGTEISELADGDISDTLTCSALTAMNFFVTEFSNTLHYGNFTVCGSGEILETNGGDWACITTPAGDTDTNASTECSGTTTYLDGEGNCDDIAPVYVDVTGDTMTGNLNLSSANVTLHTNTSCITAPDRNNSSICIYDDGSITFHAEV